MDDLGDFAGINRRQLDELGENMKTRGTDVDVAGFGCFLGQRLLKRLEDSGFAGCFLGPFGAEGPDSVLFQTQAAGFVDLELGQLETARPKIDCQK